MTGSFVIKKNRILEILFFIIIFLVNLKMTLNISNFATANLSILIIGISFISLLFTKIDDNIYWIVLFFILHCFVWKHLKCCLCHCWYQYLGIFILIKWLNILFV